MSTDVITLNEAKQALAIEETFSETNTLLAGYIQAISEKLDDTCGPIVKRTITSELHDGGTTKIYLNYRPVASLTTITEYDGTTGQVLTAHTNASQTNNQYLLDGNRGTIRRMETGDLTEFACGLKNIDVTYIAGRFDTTSDVDFRYKLAAQITLAHVWRSEQGMSTDEFGSYSTFILPKRAIDVLGNAVQQFEVA